MCESNVYVKTNGVEELVMENVAVVTPRGGGRYFLRGLLGESREISGEIEEINLMGHKIVFVQLG